MRLLVDSDFLIALTKEDDTNHITATTKAERYQLASIFVTPFVIPEAATVLSYRVSHEAAKRFLKGVRSSGLIVLPHDEVITHDTDEFFLVQRRKGTSWVDCCNVTTVRAYQLDGILSFDAFYRKVSLKVF